MLGWPVAVRRLPGEASRGARVVVAALGRFGCAAVAVAGVAVGGVAGAVGGVGTGAVAGGVGAGEGVVVGVGVPVGVGRVGYRVVAAGVPVVELSGGVVVPAG